MIGPILSRWLEAMIAVSWQFTLLFTVVGLVAWALGSRLTPAVRHALWSIVLLRLALPFGIEAPFGLAPRPETWAARMRGGEALALPLGREAGPAASLPAAPALDGEQDRPPSSRESAAANGGGAAPGRSSSNGIGATTRLPLAVFALWCGGVLSIGALQRLRSRRALRIESRVGETGTVPPAVGEALARAGAALGLRRAPRVLLVEDSVAAVRVAGVLAPRLLVPVAMTHGWSASELEAVFLHELAHLRRRDPLTRAFVNLMQTLFFFHPLVWVAARRVRVERERACDDVAVRACATGRRGYVEALLRVASEARREASGESPALTIGGRATDLRGRLSRMLAESYQPTLRTSPGLFACVVVALVVGTGASIYGERPVERALPGEAALQRLEEPADRPIRLRFTLHRAYVVDSLEAARHAEGLPWSGDFEWRGSRAGSTRGAVEAMDSPELRRLLQSRDPLKYELLIDPEGKVREVRVLAERVESGISTAVEAALNHLAFQPAVRRADGLPVFVTSNVNVFLEESGASRLDAGLSLVGGDPRSEVVDLAPRPGPGGEISADTFFDRPPYLRIVSRPEPPAAMADAAAGLYSLTLELDNGGRATSARVLSFQSPTEAFPRDEPELEPPEALRKWVEGFELETITAPGFDARAFHGVVDVEVREGRAAIATRAPMTTEAMRASIAERYRLPSGRDLDLLPPPHPRERELVYRFGSPQQSRFVVDGPSLMKVLVGEDGRPRYGGAQFGGCGLGGLLRAVGFDEASVRGSSDVLGLEVKADLVLRQGVDPVQMLDDLEVVLREKLDLGIELTAVDEPVDSIVIRGSMSRIPANPDAEGRPTIDVYTDQRDEQPGGSSGTGPARLLLAHALPNAVGMPVVDEIVGPEVMVNLQVHRSAMGTANVETVLRNLERQTGLEITVERRPSVVLLVSARN